MLDIRIHTIPPEQHRYDTCGDWLYDEIRISDLDNSTHETLVALHEFTEMAWCKRYGIDEEDVTAFDMAYEETRRLELPPPCGCKHMDEPGDDPHAPYYRGHQLATIVERMVAHDLGINWQQYNEGEE